MKKQLAVIASALLAISCSAAVAQSNNAGNTGNASRPGKTGPIGNSTQRITQEQSQGTGAQLYISPAVVRQIKQGLNKAGYDTGKVDGNWNKQAETAMKNFQQAQGLEPTGHVNLTTLSLLGVNVQQRTAGNGSGGASGNTGAGGTTGSIGTNGAGGANGGAGAGGNGVGASNQRNTQNSAQ